MAELAAALRAHGFRPSPVAAEADFVVNLIDPAAPRPFRRRSRGTFVAALALLPGEPADALRETYPLLVRALANIALCYVPGEGVLFTTMERGHYLVAAEGERELARAVAERLAPARALAPGDRERLPARPRAGALGAAMLAPRRSPRRDGGSTGLGCCRRPSRSRSSSTSATCATSAASTASAGSPTATSRCARTPAASG